MKTKVSVSNLLTIIFLGTLLPASIVTAGTFIKDPAQDRETFGTGTTSLSNRAIFYLPRSFATCTSLNSGGIFASTWLKFINGRLHVESAWSDRLGQQAIPGWTFIDIQAVSCHTNGGLWSEWRVTALKENYGTSMKIGNANTWVASAGTGFTTHNSEIFTWDYCARPEIMNRPPRARLINQGGFNYIVVQNADMNTWHCLDVKDGTFEVGVETVFVDPNNPPAGCSRWSSIPASMYLLKRDCHMDPMNQVLSTPRIHSRRVFDHDQNDLVHHQVTDGDCERGIPRITAAAAAAAAVTRATVPPPPLAHKGITSHLNRDLFKSQIKVLGLRLNPASVTKCMNELKEYVLDLPKLRSVVDDPSPPTTATPKTATKLLLLNPQYQDSTLSFLPSNLRDFLSTSAHTSPSSTSASTVEAVPYTIELSYDYWPSDAILRAILPDEVEVPTAFETVGHIAHLNLRDDQLQYKKIIGEVILDKSKHIRTVVNKLDSIDHTFRFFKMEVLAGDDDFIAELKESTCRFRFDFSQVYWNSRLQGEHERIVKTYFKNGQRIADVMAGVGPFAVPAAKLKNAIVFANDLNPKSYEYLNVNVGLNKLEHLVRAYNLDGRVFVKQSLHDLNNPHVLKEFDDRAKALKAAKAAKSNKFKTPSDKSASKSAPSSPSTSAAPKSSDSTTTTPSQDTTTTSTSPPQFQLFDHYVMNLPATAIEFLDAFRGLLKPYVDSGVITPEMRKTMKMPLIHVHCFSKAPKEEMEADVLQRAEMVLGTKLPPLPIRPTTQTHTDEPSQESGKKKKKQSSSSQHGIDEDFDADDYIHIHRVRDVAPKKEMLCISFRLPREVAFEEGAPQPVSTDANSASSTASTSSTTGGKRKSCDMDVDEPTTTGTQGSVGDGESTMNEGAEDKRCKVE
ncbi:tRNA(m(1)G37)methyltransferase [Quaeritorhiza haematococci]|nr:tRNA(m(1)G37)methyltransferase [Quaeritorhiza haematococci]